MEDQIDLKPVEEKKEREHCVIETTGNLWEYFYSGEAAVVIPTNGNINNFGHNVMNKGLAKEAKELFPLLPKLVGKAIKRLGGHNSVFLYRFPTDKVGENVKKENYVLEPILNNNKPYKSSFGRFMTVSIPRFGDYDPYWKYDTSEYVQKYYEDLEPSWELKMF